MATKANKTKTKEKHLWIITNSSFLSDMVFTTEKEFKEELELLDPFELEDASIFKVAVTNRYKYEIPKNVGNLKEVK